MGILVPNHKIREVGLPFSRQNWINNEFPLHNTYNRERVHNFFWKYSGASLLVLLGAVMSEGTEKD